MLWDIEQRVEEGNYKCLVTCVRNYCLVTVSETKTIVAIHIFFLDYRMSYYDWISMNSSQRLM